MKSLTQKNKLLLGYLISGFGDQFYTFAIPLLMLSRSHSAVIMGLLTAMEYLPTAIFGFVIGSLFDTYSRKRIMLISLLMQVLLVLAIPFLIQFTAPIWLILIIIFILGTFDLITWTGYQIFIAESVITEELPTVSGQVGLISSIQKTFGPGIAAIVLNFMHYIGGFILDALSYLSLIWTIKDYKPESSKGGDRSQKGNLKKHVGFHFLMANHDLKWLIVSFFVANIGFQVVVPMLTFLLKQTMHVSVSLIGIFFTISSVASILGNFVYLHFGKKLKLGFQLVLIGLLIMCGFAMMLFLNSFILVTVGYAIVSFGSVWAQANFFTIMQAKTPSKYKGTVTSISTTLTRIAGPIMALASGYLTKIEAHIVLIVAIICLILSVIITCSAGLNRLSKLENFN
ncbi:MFS transporter [Lactobacillus ultunensis]|uniref:Transporter, major facilitator family protein n=1 Tax=Lactobacillus ultunensis DSM 16047 TaxID=525365 RepID=C2EK72_9LACO|nr:MFS transporter [Lactobacillus ultunensis]EEJ73087.1 transporter, major facilitator family protein [Lactobacillus ultunensis DSM 16047]KRL82644.1 permease [Lactobacillus ultunensis DSM 16047]QQP29395.1 MFS transporter [Lactobacillus ultunensis]